MRKKELLSMPPLYATDEMAGEAVRDTGWTEDITYTGWSGQACSYTRRCRRYIRYFMAAEENGLLKVAVFTGDSLRAGERRPVYEVYLDRGRKEYLTFDTASGKWREAKINFLRYQGTDWTYTQEEWQTQETRDLVNRYFATGKNLNVFQAVLDFQAARAELLRKKKYRTETDRIDAVMKEVPDIPGGFGEWVEGNCFRETMFYEPRKRGPAVERMYCTHCGEWMDQPGWPDGPVHKGETLCPCCGIPATYRSWNRQKQMKEETDVALLQRMADGSGYVLRLFRALRERKHSDGWETCRVWLHEAKRAVLGGTFLESGRYEYGEYRRTGVTRWCLYAPKGGYYCYDTWPASAVMYTPNLKEELRESRFGYMDLETVFKGGSRQRVDPAAILRTLDRYPFLEYLQKCGFGELVREITEGKADSGLFDRNAADIRKALGLDGQRLGRLKQWNGGCSVLRALQVEARTGGKLSGDNIRYIMEGKVQMKDIEEAMGRTGLGLRQMLNYFSRQQERNGLTFLQTRSLYSDYLDMAQERGMDLKDDIVRRQPEMKKYHDHYLEEKNRNEACARDREVNLRFRNIREDRETSAGHFGFSQGKYVFLVPAQASDITREGRLLHHCVGASDTYLENMDRRRSYIIFLRRKEEPDSPYYTIEAKWDGTVLQWYSAYDRRPDEEEIRKVLEKWSREVGKRYRKQKREQADAAGETEPGRARAAVAV